MEIYQIHHKKALSFLKTADHLTYVTLPVVADNKLIISILDNLYRSLVHGMNTVLEHERMYKRVMPLAENFNSRFDVFRKAIIGRHGFINEEALLILELRKIVEARKESSVEFTRPGKFIICSENYKVESISIDEIKKYLSRTKNFMLKVNQFLK